MDVTALNIITGRVVPHIYAFRIETFPPSYKIGDTFRPVDVRIDEWRRIYNGLPFTHDMSWRWNAMINNSFFRDHAVHKYLEDEKGKESMKPEAFGSYHQSNEFYLNTEICDIEEAISHIKANAALPESPYKLYSSSTLKEENKGFERNVNLHIRSNQHEVISNFIKAYKAGHRNMLMYATMRFGKTVTALCCAKEINARSVLVVSAKADVSNGWEKSVQGIIGFENFKYFDKSNLGELDWRQEAKEKSTVVVFLTLQDLQGKEIKRRHEKLFNGHQWSMVIVDETHFGARAPQYGLSLLAGEQKEDIQDKIPNDDDPECLDKELKKIIRKVTLHLSGTPYRILMTNEFKEDEVIACIRYPDIIAARDEWFDENSDAQTDEGHKIEEWENPYFGFPEMIRFAFNLNEKSLDILKEYQDQGASVKFSELFKTSSNNPKDKVEKRNKFVHESEVLSFLRTIDGVENDANVLAFLDNDRIKAGQLCHHIVMVLPYCASCDAMSALIEANKEQFKNIGDYKILNVAGHDSTLSIDTCLQKIRECEEQGIKTISLTVRKMLTGVTVPEWDTMIYLRESASPEEYDQAIYRLQNPYIKAYVNEDGSIVKYNMKPQTILVDFDPQRIFKLQERKCLIYNSTKLLRDKQSLQQFIDDELNTSPIITLDHNKLRQLNATDLLDAIRHYSETRGIPEEASAIGVDETLLTNEVIIKAISKLNNIDSKQGITKKANQIHGDGEDVGSEVSGKGSDDDNNKSLDTDKNKKNKDEDAIYKKLASYYSLILYFAFLSHDSIVSLEDIINKINKGDNKRIAANLDLEIDILKIIQSHAEPYTLLSLNKSIKDANYSGNRTDLSPLENVKRVLKRCNRLSSSEIVTPEWLADEMIALLPENLFDEDGIVLDIASKQGEFALALYTRYAAKYPEECRTRIYSLCTSGLAYEFTRKTYECLGLEVKNIIRTKTSYDIIAPLLNKRTKNAEITVKDIIGKDMNVISIVGNPPYQQMDGGAGVSASPIYNYFVDIARKSKPGFVSMIMPAKWYSGGKGLRDFRESMLNDKNIVNLVDFVDSRDCFPTADIAGGICYFLWGKKHKGNCTFTHNANGDSITTQKILNSNDILLRNPMAENIVNKVKSVTTAFFDSIVSSRKPFGLATNATIVQNGDLRIRYNKGWGHFNRKDVPSGVNLIDQWNVIISYLSAEHAGQPDKNGNFKILSSLDILKPKSICTETYLVAFSSEYETEAINAHKYFQTKFLRFLVSTVALSQHITKGCFAFVPTENFTEDSDIDWSKSVKEIDTQLYAKYNLSDDEIDFIESMIKPM